MISRISSAVVPRSTAAEVVGPIVVDTALTGAAGLQPGGVDHLVATVSFPADAGDRMRQQTSRPTSTFTAAQRDGAAR